MKKIGLIAGNRRYPLILAQQAKKDGYSTVVVAIKKNTSFQIRNYSSHIYWIDIYQFNEIFEIFKKESVKDVVMAGQINPFYLFEKKIIEHPNIKNFFKEIEDRRAVTIFGFIAHKLTEEGFNVLDSRVFMREFIPQRGSLTIVQPDFNLWQDIYFGWDLAKMIAVLDIGQTVAVKNRSIVAVEAIEGTDKLILRAAKLAGNGLVIVKVSRPSQDMRFDLPVVGMMTIKNLIKIKAACLAIEAEKTIFLDKEKAVSLAQHKGISIVAL
ncbi:MAG: UDP-2,3-diacylglucosamine diphosphatase LpxI [Candidatus Omnitrophica bacterium]|nr:UDP-2,3-diacylglucosamine diphosphatase LpxI [Candidatus Omnitrophota bacterium]